MLEFVLAMVTLTNADPDPVQAAPAHIAERLNGGLDVESPLASTKAATSQPEFAACTYGAPPLTSQYLSDVAELTRTLTTPQCALQSANLSGLQAGQFLYALAPFGFVGSERGLFFNPRALLAPTLPGATSVSASSTVLHPAHAAPLALTPGLRVPVQARSTFNANGPADTGRREVFSTSARRSPERPGGRPGR